MARLRWFALLLVVLTATQTAHAGAPRVEERMYVTSGSFFGTCTEPGVNLACFDVVAGDAVVGIQVFDLVAAHVFADVSFRDAAGRTIGGFHRFCDAVDVPVPAGAVEASVYLWNGFWGEALAAVGMNPCGSLETPVASTGRVVASFA